MSKDFNILVIGNGFDLAHGLPTKYGDFLQFCEYIPNFEIIYVNSEKLSSMFHERPLSVFNRILNTMSDEEFATIKNRLSKYKNENIWHKYFFELYTKNLSGENWIDFESEISDVIRFLDKEENHIDDDPSLYFQSYLKDIQELDNKKVEELKKIKFISLLLEYSKCFKNDDENQKKVFNAGIIRDKLLKDLESLTTILNYYLFEFIEKLNIYKNYKKFRDLSPDMLFSFNYTHTYNRVFQYLNKEQVFHIHGECNKDEANKNIVLGIDEYYQDERKNTHTEYSSFKKYVQRILKNTSSIVFKIKEQLQKRAGLNNLEKTHIYFYGHSLDITDKDILKVLLEHNKIKATIYCRFESDKGNYIAKLLKIIGQEEVIKRFEAGLLNFVVLEDQNSLSS